MTINLKGYWHVLAFCLGAGILLSVAQEPSWVAYVSQFVFGFFFCFFLGKATKV